MGRDRRRDVEVGVREAALEDAAAAVGGELEHVDRVLAVLDDVEPPAEEQQAVAVGEGCRVAEVDEFGDTGSGSTRWRPPAPDWTTRSALPSGVPVMPLALTTSPGAWVQSPLSVTVTTSSGPGRRPWPPSGRAYRAGWNESVNQAARGVRKTSLAKVGVFVVSVYDAMIAPVRTSTTRAPCRASGDEQPPPVVEFEPDGGRTGARGDDAALAGAQVGAVDRAVAEGAQVGVGAAADGDALGAEAVGQGDEVGPGALGWRRRPRPRTRRAGRRGGGGRREQSSPTDVTSGGGLRGVRGLRGCHCRPFHEGTGSWPVRRSTDVCHPITCRPAPQPLDERPTVP